MSGHLGIDQQQDRVRTGGQGKLLHSVRETLLPLGTWHRKEQGTGYLSRWQVA